MTCSKHKQIYEYIGFLLTWHSALIPVLNLPVKSIFSSELEFAYFNVMS